LSAVLLAAWARRTAPATPGARRRRRGRARAAHVGARHRLTGGGLPPRTALRRLLPVHVYHARLLVLVAEGALGLPREVECGARGAALAPALAVLHVDHAVLRARARRAASAGVTHGTSTISANFGTPPIPGGAPPAPWRQVLDTRSAPRGAPSAAWQAGAGREGAPPPKSRRSPTVGPGPRRRACLCCEHSTPRGRPCTLNEASVSQPCTAQRACTTSTIPACRCLEQNMPRSCPGSLKRALVLQVGSAHTRTIAGTTLYVCMSVASVDKPAAAGSMPRTPSRRT